MYWYLFKRLKQILFMLSSRYTWTLWIYTIKASFVKHGNVKVCLVHVLLFNTCYVFFFTLNNTRSCNTSNARCGVWSAYLFRAHQNDQSGSSVFSCLFCVECNFVCFCLFVSCHDIVTLFSTNGFEYLLTIFALSFKKMGITFLFGIRFYYYSIWRHLWMNQMLIFPAVFQIDSLKYFWKYSCGIAVWT